MDKSLKGASKSFNKSVKSLGKMEGVNVALFIAVIAMILNAKMLRPMVSNIPGKLGLILFICLLATTDRILGLLGVILFMSVNNGLIEGLHEEGHKEDEDPEAGQEIAGFRGREGEGTEDTEEEEVVLPEEK
jgi:hypothetical protein